MRLMSHYQTLPHLKVGRIWFNVAVVRLHIFDVAQMISDIRVSSVLRGKTDLFSLVYSAQVKSAYLNLEIETSATLTCLT